MPFLTLRLITVGLLATVNYANADSSLEVMNNRLAELYKNKSITENKLLNCELKYRDDSSKKCHDLEGQYYSIKDEIKRLEPKIREKELLAIISSKK